MPGLALNTLFACGFSRQVFIIYGGDAASDWRCYELGKANTFLPLKDVDNAGFTIFPFDTPALPPTGYSPTGDLVFVNPSANRFDVFPLPPTSTLDTGPGYLAITWQWGAVSKLGPDTQAIVYVPGQNGEADNWIFAVPSELTLVRKNPLFP